MKARWHAAADWLQRMNRNEVPDQEFQAWLDWRAQSNENDRAFEDMQDLYRALREAPDEQKAALRELVEPQSRTNHTKVGWSLAAGIVLAVGAALTWWQLPKDPPVYSTGRGEHRDVSLPDGSRMVLAGDSAVTVVFTDTQRVLSLRRGEAYFQVKREAARPFSVQAGTVRVNALGTAFDVQHGSERVTVSVKEGAVEVAQANSPSNKAVRLGPGEKIAVNMESVKAAVAAVTRVDPAAVASWQEGQLQFAGEPLSVVIDSVNRYARRQVVITDAQVGALTYTGTVQRERADEWIDNLPQVFPLSLLISQDGAAVLVRRQPE